MEPANIQAAQLLWDKSSQQDSEEKREEGLGFCVKSFSDQGGWRQVGAPHGVKTRKLYIWRQNGKLQQAIITVNCLGHSFYSDAVLSSRAELEREHLPHVAVRAEHLNICSWAKLARYTFCVTHRNYSRTFFISHLLYNKKYLWFTRASMAMTSSVNGNVL